MKFDGRWPTGLRSSRPLVVVGMSIRYSQGLPMTVTGDCWRVGLVLGGRKEKGARWALGLFY